MKIPKAVRLTVATASALVGAVCAAAASETEALSFIHATVVRGPGAAAPELTAADFKILVDGKAQTAVSLEAFGTARSGEPRTLVLVIDDIGLAARTVDLLRRWISILLADGVRDGDVVTVVTASGPVWIGKVPEVRADVAAMLDKMAASDFDVTGRRKIASTGTLLSRINQAARNVTHAPGAKTLFLFAWGLGGASLDQIQQVATSCQRAGLVLNWLSLREPLTMADSVGSAADPIETTRSYRYLNVDPRNAEELAKATGGVSESELGNVDEQLKRIVEEARGRYRLGLRSTGAKGARRLQIELARPGLRVRAPDRILEKDAAPVPSAAETALAHGHDIDAAALDAAAFLLDDRPGGKVRLMLAAEPRAWSAGTDGGATAFAFALTRRDTGESVRRDLRTAGATDRAVVAEMEVPAGVFMARFVVSDEKTGHVCAVSRRIEVPLPNVFRLSSPIVTDRLEGGEGRPTRPVLRARRTFRPADRLVYLFEVFGSEGSTAIGGSYHLRRADGATVREGARSAIAPSADGRIVRLVALPLEGLAPGGYELIIGVDDAASGRSLERSEAFEVVAGTP